MPDRRDRMRSRDYPWRLGRSCKADGSATELEIAHQLEIGRSKGIEMDKVIHGKVAVVAGGSRGIGAAAAEALAKRGANVAISYVCAEDAAKSVVEKIESSGASGAAFRADQADPRQVDMMLKQVVDRFGVIDILVNSAGISGYGKVGDPAVNLSKFGSSNQDLETEVDPLVRYAYFDKMWKINVFGLAALVRSAVHRMNDHGRIIAVGSMGGSRVRLAGVSDYCATKAAVAHYCRGWARDLGPRQITVNAIQPGPIDTDLHPDDDSALAASVREVTCLGRFGKPDEVGALIAFLAGPEAAYITGAVINIDGGANA